MFTSQAFASCPIVSVVMGITINVIDASINPRLWSKVKGLLKSFYFTAQALAIDHLGHSQHRSHLKMRKA